MPRHRIPFLIVALIAGMFALPAPLTGMQHEVRDDTIRIRASKKDTLRPFTENAHNYWIPTYPRVNIGGGLLFLSPDLTSLDAPYEGSEAPSRNPFSPAFNMMVEAQFVSSIGILLSIATGSHGSDYNRYALTLRGFMPLGYRSSFKLFGGIGLARVIYDHDGSTGRETGQRIYSNRNATHILIGLCFESMDSPIVAVSIGYEWQSRERGINLSTPLYAISIFF